MPLSITIIASCICVIAVIFCAVMARIVRDDKAKMNREKKELLKRVENAEGRAERLINAERKKSRAVSRIAEYQPEDGDFLNRIAEYAKKPDMQFVFEQAHRSIYEAALSANNDAMVLNAIGKGKGVRMIEATLLNPLKLFGLGGNDAE